MPSVVKSDSPRTIMELHSPSVFHKHLSSSMHGSPSKVLSAHRPTDDSNVEGNSSVQVAIRVRPFNSKEEKRECLHLYNNTDENIQRTSDPYGKTSDPNDTMDTEHIEKFQTIHVGEDENKHTFTFDQVFPSTTQQQDVYSHCVIPLVHSCLEGYNASILAYGQTGSGKTHTILGDVDSDQDLSPEQSISSENEGIIPRSLRGLFQGLRAKQRANTVSGGNSASNKELPASPTSKQTPFEYSVKISFIEIYGDEIRDLLDNPEPDDDLSTSVASRQLKRSTSELSVSRRPLTRRASMKKKISIRDGKAGEGAEVLGAEKIEISSAEEAMFHVRKGLRRRVTGATAMNAHSSRSHAIFTILVHQTMRKGNAAKNHAVEMKTSKLHFVDLCGSESAKRAHTYGKRLREGIDINVGLLALGNVISALGKQSGAKSHVPYRDSKLTRILKGSLGGNHKTLMIACISPSYSNENETMSTLRYANRAKNIKNKAKINIDPQYLVVSELRDQVAALAMELLRYRSHDEFDGEDEEDCPFSINFLNDLVKNGDAGNKWNRKKKISRKEDLNRRSSTNAIVDSGRKKTSKSPLGKGRPMTSPGNMGISTQLTWDIPEGFDSFDTENEMRNWDEDSAEDPELAKNIESYDFALATLRQSVDQTKLRQSMKESSLRNALDIVAKVKEEDERKEYPIEYDRRGIESDDQSSQIGSPMRHSTQAITPESPPPALKKIRNIDELYDYLKQNTFVNEDGDVVDDEGTVVSHVVHNHVSKLEGAISMNERLLKEMETSNEVFEMMKSDNIEKLAEIESDLHAVRREKKNLASAHRKIESPKNSKGLERALNLKDKKISKLLEERDEVLQLNDQSNENLKNIQEMKDSIEVMKKQHKDLMHIQSRPRSRGITPVASFDSRFSRNSSKDIGESLRTLAWSNEARFDANNEIEQSKSTEMLSNKQIPENEDSFNNESKHTELPTIEKVPSFFQANLDLSGHSYVSRLDTPGLQISDHDFGGKEYIPRNRAMQEILNTRFEDEKLIEEPVKRKTSPKIVSDLPRISHNSQILRRKRGSRPPRVVRRRSSQSLRGSRMRTLSRVSKHSTKSNTDSISTLTSRSAFEIIDESVSKNHRTEYQFSKSAYYDRKEEQVSCGDNIFNRILEVVGLKHPAARQWNA